MFYYNPYFSMPVSKGGMFKNLFKGINFSSILNGTQKTLNIINQTIPVVKEVTPLFRNGKTLLKLMSEFNRNDSNYENINSLNEEVNANKKVSENSNYSTPDNGDSPVFFL
ncbi:MAG: hypothetical protein IJZ36_00010 [Bacilli bacterium]|nr:hypothetical protein [Bacilli bacterium]